MQGLSGRFSFLASPVRTASDEEGTGCLEGAPTVIGEFGLAARCQPHGALRSQEVILRREACRGQLCPARLCDAPTGPGGAGGLAA